MARAIAIVSISLNHAVNRTYQIYNNEYEEFLLISQFANWIKVILLIFSHIGVPLFLMITGALVLNKSMDSEAKIRRFYKHNLLRLLLTSEIWYAIMYWFLLAVAPIYHLLETQGVIGSIPGMIQTMLFQNQITFGNMWYIPMILCVYTTIPFAILAKNHFQKNSLAIVIPLSVLFLNHMVLPTVNNLSAVSGMETYSTALSAINIFSIYYIYIFIGNYIHSGNLKKVKTWIVAVIFLVTFALMCVYQFYMFARPEAYLLDYDFPILPFCAGALFELIRRKADLLKALTRPITYLSKISLAIFFVHVMIMWPMYWYLDLSGFGHVQQVLIYEVVSVGGSVIIIFLLSKIKFIKNYVFMIKD
jgi:surface polysaccharide O-acyltransferase-like enzyme